MIPLKEFLISKYDVPEHYMDNPSSYRNLQVDLMTLHQERLSQRSPLGMVSLDDAALDFVDRDMSKGLEWIAAAVLHSSEPEFVRSHSGRPEIINHPYLSERLSQIKTVVEKKWEDYASACAWFQGEKDHKDHSEDLSLFSRYHIHLDALYDALIDFSTNSLPREETSSSYAA